MPDTKDGRDKKAHDEEKRQRERDIDDEREQGEADENGREERDDDAAETELAADE